MPVLERIVALAVAAAPVSTAGEPPPVQRPEQLEPAPPEVVQPRPARVDPDLHVLKRVLKQGDQAVEEGNPEGALEMWEAALRATAPVEPARRFRTALVHRSVSIHIRLFQRSGEPQHLVDAHALVRSRLWEYDRYHSRDPISRAERDDLAARQTEIAGYMREAEGTREHRRWYDLQMRAVLQDDPSLKRRYRGGRGMAIAGGPMLATGTAFAVSSYGLGEVPIGFFVAGVVTAVAGAVLLPTGLVVHLRARKEVRQRADARIDQRFASEPPPAKGLDNSPLSLWLGPISVRF